MKIRICLVLCFFLIYFPVIGQNRILDDYIREGLTNNLALRQKLASYDKSLEAVKEARRMFYPNVSFNARYSRAEGGRIIEFPVGDLLNPVYSTLNALTMSNIFPQIENEEFSFLRPREHETKVQVIQPIFNTGLYFNQKIKNEMNRIQQIDVEMYKRFLVSEVKKAYYNYLQTLQVRDLGFETMKLLEENIRVSKKLFENQMVTQDVVYRSEAELSKNELFIADAEKNIQVARSYFNFLLNRSLDEDINGIESFPGVAPQDDLEQAEFLAVNNREELDLLEHYITASEYNLKIKRAQNHPMLLAAVDYGFQGEKYRFTSQYDFVIASFVLKWDIFSGFQNQARIKQAKIDKEILTRQKEELEQKIKLEVTQTFYDLKASFQSVRSAEKELLHARNAFKLVDRKYREGMASLIEFIDSRTTMTQAEWSWIITRFDLQVKLAEFERITASYNVKVPETNQ
ncbi:MAG: TolC family protein [Bacteroidales bacterium]|nr:MAG: TolC family protein [Bacteroidales bacterium]